MVAVQNSRCGANGVSGEVSSGSILGGAAPGDTTTGDATSGDGRSCESWVCAETARESTSGDINLASL